MLRGRGVRGCSPYRIVPRMGIELNGLFFPNSKPLPLDGIPCKGRGVWGEIPPFPNILFSPISPSAVAAPVANAGTAFEDRKSVV